MQKIAPWAIGLAALGLSGCYYGHLGVGQTRLLLARESVKELLADPDTPDALHRRLLLVGDVRAFAAELGLDVRGQYTSYVPWPGDRVVTTVVATRPGEVEARSFRFPIVGEVPYKGFFDLERAQDEAAQLRAEGLDVCLVPVAAYSTLGWMDDPVTEPMLRSSDGELVETLIHELVHATVFVESEPDFNEGVASFIGEEGVVRFYTAREESPARKDEGEARRQRVRVTDNRAVSGVLLAFRRDVAALYDDGLEPELQRDGRAALETEAREALAKLPLRTRDAGRIAREARLGNACLAIRGTYAADTPRHADLLAKMDWDLSAFVARLREVADADDPRSAFFD
ncbi:MAG: aminopeptidase [Proteobacteria bacterium]|nr:aminopeptidase [Pseudomonadota bacterium]